MLTIGNADTRSTVVERVESGDAHAIVVHGQNDRRGVRRQLTVDARQTVRLVNLD